MSETIESYSLAGRDAATLEREERLAKAKRKLKSYRAKQAKSSSTASSVDPLSRPTSAASGSTNVHRRSISKSNILNPIASTSKGVAVAGLHGRKASNSRVNRNSFTHSHTRSKASISISVSAPMNYEEPEDFNPFANNNNNNNSDYSTPSSDNPYATTYKSNRNSWTAQLPTNPSPLSRDDASTSTSYKRLSNSLDPRTAVINHSTSTSPSPSTVPFPLPTAESKAHNRKSSRHSRRLSITNFRDSIEIVSGQGNYSGVLTPTIGSFAPLPISSLNPYDVSPHRSPPTPVWSNDPIKVLEALKERGRLETEEENDQKRTRMGALEALEGRLSAPSEMIDLGNEEEGQLLHAPPSPGYTTTSTPTSPTPVFSPMYGLGLVGGSTPVAVKRNSWNALGPVTAAGAKGALDLGMLIEEEEEEEEEIPEQDDVLSTVSSPPRKARASPRRRPSSLSITSPHQSISSIAIASPIDETPTSSTFAARPMRLSLSLSSGTSSIGVTPSTSASTFPERPAPPLRSLTLGSMPLSAPLSREPSHESVSPNERRRSLLYTSSSSTTTSPAPPSARGLRPLSIGSFSPSVISPSPTESKQRSPTSSRSSLPPSSYHHPNNSINNTNSATSTPSTRNPTPSASKRSSISYRTSPVASLASSEGPLSASAQAARRPWRTSFSGTSISSTSSTPGPTTSSSAPLSTAPFSFSNSHGSFGGFGDLQADDGDVATTGEREGEETEDVDDDLVNQRIRELFGRSSMDEAAKAALVLESLNTQITTLQFQLEQANVTLESSTTRHGIEMEEFEKRAGEEARGMRMRISELEKSIEETSIVRRFEVEGLTREAEQAKEAMEDLVEERDSLREDVDGWRNRCAQLEKVVKKDREDEALSNAQIKLIGDMRDQIYNLVATLDRERVDHEETKAVVERLLVERAPSPPSEEDTFEELPAIGSRGEELSNKLHHAFKAASDTSVVSTNSVGRSLSGNTTEATSVGTDSEDNNNGFSKSSSPTSSTHSSFPNSTSSSKSQSHDNDFANAVAIGGLQTLAEEEEEEEVEKVASLPLVVAIPERDREVDRIRSGSGSTGSTADSEAMPMTPSKDSMNHHNRSDSFVRHWSFPKGSVSSVRMSVDEDHSFFDLNRHTSLPALPIPESILPPFLCADLMVDEEQFATFASTSLPTSASAPSLRGPFPTPPPRLLPTPPPRNQNRLSAQPMRSPTQERLSPQQPTRRAPVPPQIQTRNIPPPPRPSSASNSRPPPLSPSALHQSAFSGSQASSNGSFSLNSPSRLTRLSQLSLTGIVTSLGGWSPSSSVSAVASAVTNSGRLSMSTTREDEEERMFTAQSKQQQQVHKTPSSLAYESRSPQKFIGHDQQPRPLASRLRVLDFRPVCCSSENTPLFDL